MNIQTDGGIKRITYVKFVEFNGRKMATHRFYMTDMRYSFKYSLSDYLTGVKIAGCDAKTTAKVLKKAKVELSKFDAVVYDWGKHEVINE